MIMPDPDLDQHYEFDDEALPGEEPLGSPSLMTTRGLEAFGRKVTATASQLMGPLSDPISSPHYQAAMAEVHKQLQRPTIQRSMFSMARTTPRDIVRASLSTSEISHRALTHVSDELLANIPDANNSYSLFQGFRATHPDLGGDDGGGGAKTPGAAGAGAGANGRGRGRRRVSRGRRLLEDASPAGARNKLDWLNQERESMMHELEMLGIRKNMSSCEIRDIDTKIANLHGMRNIILDRLADLEQEETVLEHDIVELEHRAEAAQVLLDDEEQSEAAATATPTDADHDDSGFMSQSIYEKIPSGSSTSSRGRRRSIMRRKSMPVLHEHYEPGTAIREINAHADSITSLDFDTPFGTMVTSSLDDTVRVWDLNAGRCIGLLEGHAASVRVVQIEDNIVATGSMDATIRLWDLSRAQYDPHGSLFSGGRGGRKGARRRRQPDERDSGDSDSDDDDDDGDESAIAFDGPDSRPAEPPPGSMGECPLFTLQAHVDTVTALHFRGDVLVSGSADKTLRQWDLEKGRCVQTLDVMWASAQATNLGKVTAGWRSSARAAAAESDFVGALQVFEAALACGTADGMVRLWDLRSGQVHRSLVGHTGPVTCLQFDDVHLVTASLDRSVRIWDLRTGSIHDAYAYDHPVTSMMFDTRRIVCAAGEDVVKVYDKVECSQWDCGAGAIGEDGKRRSPSAVSMVERVRVRDGYLVEGRQDGRVGIWTC